LGLDQVTTLIKEGDMKADDKVMVYQDPITQKKPEGEAVLVKRYPSWDSALCEGWVVDFGDGGGEFVRLIKTVKL
jgi:hypothetical protein